MTREEQVKVLQEHRIEFQHDFGWNTSVLEALDSVIKEMERDLSENKGDLIRRQAVNNVLYDLGSGDEENGGDPEYMSALYDCKELIDQIPSVENKGERMSNSVCIKLIDGYSGEEISRMFSTVVPRVGEIIHLQNMPEYNYHVRCVTYSIGVDEHSSGMITYVKLLVTV